MESIQATSGRTEALHSGIRVEIVTVIWMTLEGTIAIAAGVAAGSGLLIAFGADSVIELISGGVLLWRLAAESKQADLPRIEAVERRATQISAVLLTLLCLYVVATTLIGLFGRAEPESSLAGILVSVGALIIMPLLARTKRSINRQLESAALRADAAESITCAYMAGTVLVGLALNALLGWWWAEYIAAAVFLYWLFAETRETFEAARGEEDPS